MSTVLILLFSSLALQIHVHGLPQNQYEDIDEDIYHPEVNMPQRYSLGQQTRRQRSVPVADEEFDWEAEAQRQLQKSIYNDPIIATAKNIILFIGDGMGVSTVTAARWYRRDKNNLKPQEAKMAFEDFPHVGMSKTYNTDTLTSDSAGTSTAFLGGVKARIATIGVNQRVTKGNCTAIRGNEVKTILKYAQDEGKWTGVVTTTRITHATPAGAYASVADKAWEHTIPDTVENREQCKDIADQLINTEYGKNIRVIFGGGRERLLPKNMTDPEPEVFPGKMGKREDGRNLLQEWLDIKRNQGLQQDEYAFVKNKEEFDNINTNTINSLLGLFNPSHMDYEYDRKKRNETREPSLAEMVEKSINIMKRNDKGFFLYVEGGRIDQAHHDGNAFRALEDTLAFDEAVQKAVGMTDIKDTLIVVTADHAHVMSIGGYPKIEEPILGIAGMGADGKPYTTLHYANGKGYRDHRTYNGSLDFKIPRIDLTTVDTLDPDFKQDAGVPRRTETHGGEDVAIYARGPMAHLLNGIYEQSYIAHVMMYASCVGKNKDHCLKEGERHYPGGRPNPTNGAILRNYSFSFIIVLIFISALIA